MKSLYTLFNHTYHYKLIELFLETTLKSSLANGIAFLFIIYTFYQTVPTSILVAWSLLFLLYMILRQIFAKKLSHALSRSKEHVNLWLTSTFYLIFFGAFLLSLMSFITVSYGTFNQQLVMLIILAGLLAGSSVTLSPIFIIFRIFLFTILFGMIGSFFFFNTPTAYLIIAASIIFGTLIHSASSTLFSYIKKSIIATEALEDSKIELANLNTTLEKRVESELAKSQEQMEYMFQQSRLAQMGEMISMIAHQWRQPLSSITAAIASLKFKAALDDNLEKKFLKEKLNNIESYALHLSTTISDFRGFSKTQKERKEIQFSSIIDETLKIIHNSLIVHNITLTVNIKSDPTFNSFPNELKQVILNILKNAEDILIEKEIHDPIITATISSTTDSAILTLEDNAGGIDEAFIDKIFDPYFTTKLYSDGTGLGLYMSKMIVHEHCKGKLEVKNTDKGAAFILTMKR